MIDNDAMTSSAPLSPPVRDVILTGMPRSGTTLACSLLNQCADVLALVEPMDVAELARLEGDAARRAAVLAFCAQVRTAVAAGQPVPQGLLPDGSSDNTFSAGAGDNGLRAPLVRYGSAVVNRPLASGYRLVIKHPNAFTALLPALQPAFDCFALVRNPLAALASWNTLKVGLREGRAPAAERLDGALAEALAGCPDALSRQVCLVNWYFHRYAVDLPASHVLRYEDLVAASGATLARLHPAAAGVHAALSARNRNAVYDRGFMQRALAALLEAPERAWADLYCETALRALLSGGSEDNRGNGPGG